MRSSASAHARSRAQPREVAGAAFYTHVATFARQPGESAVENRPEDVVGESRLEDDAVDWERSLFPITLPPTKHRRSTECFHPRDPRRQRQLERERNEFATKWRTEIDDENHGEDDGGKWKTDQREGDCEDEGGESYHENGTAGREGEGVGRKTVVLITIGGNEDESEVTSRTEPKGRKRFREEDDDGSRNRDDLTRPSSDAINESEGAEALPTLSTAIDEGEPVGAKRPKITKDDPRFCDTPELLDERVGNASPFIVRIPRTAITLNLNSYNTHISGSAKKDATQSRPSTEIRLADSSVPDSPPNGGDEEENEENIVPVKKCTVTKKPKIIEDLTCIEGTILSRTSLKEFAEEPSHATRQKGTPEADENSAGNGCDDDAPRKSRIREKFRRLFGNDMTLSESDEEKRITAKVTTRKRRNESRMSSDSGVCLNEHTSDIICSEALEKQRDNQSPGECPREKLRKNTEEDLGEYTKENLEEYPRETLRTKPGKYPRENSIGNPREFPSEDLTNSSIGKSRESPSEDPREISSMKKEETEVDSAQVLSMPLLDCEQRAEEAKDKALPDSSTSLLERISTQPDSSSGGKLTILVTPLNVQDSDAFDPLRLEFDLSEEAQISTPTSTTSGPPIVAPIKLESSFEDRLNLVGTYVDDSCQIVDRLNVKEDLSPETETESCDDDRLFIAEDLEPETCQTPRECEGSKASDQGILETPIEPQWRPDSMSGSEKKSSNVTDVNSSSDSSATVDKNSDETKDLVGSSLLIEKVTRPETAFEIQEKIPKDLTSVVEASNGAHQKVLIISARIVDFDPASGMLVGPGEAIKVSDETSPETVDLNSASDADQLKLENYVSLTRPSNDETIVSNDSSAKFSEITIDDSLTVERKSVNVAFEFELNGLTPQGLKDQTKIPRSFHHEVPDSEIPKCVFDSQKPKDVPKEPNFRVLHPSELGSRWCPTPLTTEAPQSQPRFSPKPAIIAGPRFSPSPAIAQPQFAPSPAMAQPRFSHSAIIAQSPLYPLFPRYPNPQILRNPSYHQIRQPPPEVLIQTPPPSPLEQMQFLVSQTSSSALGIEDLSCNKSSGYVHGPLGPRPVQTGSGLKPTWATPTSSPNAESPLEKQYSLMSRIFDGLISMASFVERIRRESDMATIIQIDKDYVAKRAALFVELRRYAYTQGTSDLRTIVTRIINYYDCLVPPERRTLSIDVVHYILKLEHATMASPLYATRPSEPRPPPPYRPVRPSVTQSSLFTDSQREQLDNQMSAYRRLRNVLMYQLVAQRSAEEEAAKTKRTRRKRRNPKAPAGQNKGVQAPAAEGRERPSLSTGRELRRLAPAPADHPRTLQQTMECTVERVMRKEGTGICTVPDKSHEEIVELALRDASIDKTVAYIVDELFRQHPTERTTEGQAVERNSQGEISIRKFQGQNMAGNIQGRCVDVNGQCQTVDVHVQGQTTDINAQRQRIDVNVQGQRIDVNVQGQTIGVTFQDQSIDSNVQGQSVEENIQFRAIEINVEGQDIEKSSHGHIIEINVEGQDIEKSSQGQIVERSVQGQAIDVNVRGQAVERNVQGQDIDKSRQRQIFETGVQGQAMDINVQGQYTEKSVQGQTTAMTVQDQEIEKSRQGQIIERSVHSQAIDVNVRGQAVERNVQGQTIEITVQGPDIEKSRQGQIIERSVQGQTIEMTVKGQDIERSVRGRAIDINVQDQYTENSVHGQAIDINFQGQYTEKSVKGQTVVDPESQTKEANVPGQAIERSVQFDPIKVNARAEAIEDNLPGQAIVEDSPVDSALNRSSSSVEDGNTSVLDVLKEFEVLDSITRGPVSRGSKLSKTTKSPEDNKQPNSIAKERGSEAADPTCPEDSPRPTTISTEDFRAKTDNHKNSDSATSVDVEGESSRIVPVITIDDDEDWDLASMNSVETVRDAEGATIADEISILDVKSISKDVFNNMGVKVDEATVAPNEEQMVGDETAEGCIDIKTELEDCFQCGKRSEVVCEQCRLAAYCSPECHQEHWSAIHHLTCKPAPQEIIETNE